MADETTISATEAPAAAPAAKKTRAPRKPKVAAEAVATEVTAATPEASVKKTRAKRGSKLVAANAEKSVVEPKKAVTRTLRAKAAAAPVAAATSDEFADLLKLEEENKTLRKALSEKLRAENADLRKRLGQV